MAIYVKFAEIKKPRTVLEFLKLFYSRHKTNDYALGHYTYHDKECENIQDSHNWKSFDDLLELTQTYYPSIKPLKLMHYLLKVKIQKSHSTAWYQPNLNVCGTMGRLRYIPHQPYYYSIDIKMGKSKYTWSELLTPLGINSKEDFLNYIK